TSRGLSGCCRPRCLVRWSSSARREKLFGADPASYIYSETPAPAVLFSDLKLRRLSWGSLRTSSWPSRVLYFRDARRRRPSRAPPAARAVVGIGSHRVVRLLCLARLRNFRPRAALQSAAGRAKWEHSPTDWTM